MLIKLSKGLDIPIKGTPAQSIEPSAAVHSVGLLGGDYVGLKPRLLVAAGDQVKLGQPLFIDKRDPAVKFTAPGSGTVSAINRGARRALQSVVIDLDGADEHQTDFNKVTEADPRSLDAAAICNVLQESGLWTAFRSRPFSKVPQSSSKPGAIFVTAIDTNPLAGDPEPVIAQHIEAFRTGLTIIERLTPGPLYVCTSPDLSVPVAVGKAQQVRFSGPHPAGLPGTHMHHLHPVAVGRSAWHISYQDVIAIGHLFTTGRIWTERVIALGGSGFSRPRLITTRLGANSADLTNTELAAQTDAPARLISGSVLTGHAASGATAYLGRYHLQLSALADTSQRRLFGWLNLIDTSYSFASRLARQSNQSNLFDFSTSAHGRPTALIAINAFDRLIPMDILTAPLLRALLIGDTDQAQALGALEMDAEDLALCSFVCPGKNDYGTALRLNLEQIERDG